jgi:hypothetical protein
MTPGQAWGPYTGVRWNTSTAIQRVMSTRIWRLGNRINMGKHFHLWGRGTLLTQTHADKIITYSSRSFAGNINHISRKRRI